MLIKVANSIMVLSLLGIKVIYFEGQYIIYNLNEECWNSYVDSLSPILGVLVYICVCNIHNMCKKLRRINHSQNRVFVIPRNRHKKNYFVSIVIQ